MPSSDLVAVHPLFHLGYCLPDDTPQLFSLFSHTRFVLLCGCTSRALKIAHAFSTATQTNYCQTDRFAIFRPNPSVLIAAHGMGLGSVDILLHEIHKLLRAVSVSNYKIIRIGSCGGIGVPAGTVVVTKRPLNNMFQPWLQLDTIGQTYKFPANLDPNLSAQLVKKAQQLYPSQVIHGDTLCASTFYVAQGRVDGAFAMETQQDRENKLQLCKAQGVVNFEMESLPLAAFATKVGVSAAVVCVALVNRLKGETPVEERHVLQQWEERAVNVVVQYVNEQLAEL